jgi:hypothetical protein
MVLYQIERVGDRIYVTCGERELRFGMQWSVEYSLAPNDAFLTQRTLFYNPGGSPNPWMSWSNAALPSAADTEFHFPDGEVLAHSSVMETLNWKRQGPSRESDIREMTGYFWRTRDTNAFGAFTPSFGTGLYHIADEADAPGIKLWSYGRGMDQTWATLSTAGNTPYIEIQGGPIRDQSIKLELQPKATHLHCEYWLPTAEPVDIYSLKIPAISLRPAKDIPLFGWARNEDVNVWNELQQAFLENSRAPIPPELYSVKWPPSGMEDLAPAFEWAIKHSDPDHSSAWRFYYGVWIAGRGEIRRAINILLKPLI